MSTSARTKAVKAEQDEAEQTAAKMEVGLDDGDTSPRKAATRKRKSLSATSATSSSATPSSLPLLLSKPGTLSTTLLAIRDPSLSLTNDTGIIGRLILPAHPSATNNTVTVDLKGRLYSGHYQPTHSLLLITQRQSEARIDAVVDAVCSMAESEEERTERQRRETEDGGAEDSADELEADVNRSERTEQREKKKKEQAKAKTKREAGKAGGGSVSKKASSAKKRKTSSSSTKGSSSKKSKSTKGSGTSRSKKK